jgi:predicted nucleic acid-binding protein
VITAIDSSALIAIHQGEASAEAWMEILVRARFEGALVISPVVAAEFYAAVEDRVIYDRALAVMGVRLRPISLDAACEAGRIFRFYRNQGGPREYLIPDFLIGAHAATDCDRLAAADRGYLRRYFPNLDLLSVEG